MVLVSGCRSQVPGFDENRAFTLLEQQCAFGPRNPGSEGHKQCLDFLFKYMKERADQVVKQPFMFTDPRTGKSYLLHNVIASFGKGGRRILLCAHWDTRPLADYDPDPSKRGQPIPGANDGASGVAILLEIAELLKKSPPALGIDIVLFDGEDSGEEGVAETWCRGSTFFARNKLSSYQPEFALLVDMVGDRDLRLPQEANSRRYAPQLVDRIWKKARDLGFTEFTSDVGEEILDDHLPLLETGIPAVDIIDFDYPYWHTISDSPDKCSPASLGIVGTVLLHLIYE